MFDALIFLLVAAQLQLSNIGNFSPKSCILWL